jgi:stage V sporulation protein B
MLVGFVQQGLLGSLLGAEAYGTLSRASAIANIANNVIITGSIQGASRFITEAPEEQQPGAHRGTLRIHAGLALPLAALFLALALGFVLSTGAGHLAPLLLASGLIVLAYTLYAPLVGTLNGRRLFSRQALLDTVYATLRTGAMVVGAWLLLGKGLGALGAMAGFALAALAILPIAARVAGLGQEGPGSPPFRVYLAAIGPLALGQFFLNALMQSDVSLLGYLATRSAEEAGLVGAAAAAAADRSAGIYKACQLFSFLPYQLLVSINFILFPMLTKAAHDGDREAIGAYVRGGMRLALLLAGVMVAVIFGLAPHLLRLAFKADIHEHGAATLRTLALGQGAFALYGICTAVLSSLHRERWTMGLNAAATALLFGLGMALIPGSPVGAPIAQRTALATSLTLALALLTGAVLVRRVAGALVSPLSALRVLLAAALTGFAGSQLSSLSRPMTLLAAAGMGLLYLTALLLTGELGRQDLALVRRVLGRRLRGAAPVVHRGSDAVREPHDPGDPPPDRLLRPVPGGEGHLAPAGQAGPGARTAPRPRRRRGGALLLRPHASLRARQAPRLLHHARALPDPRRPHLPGPSPRDPPRRRLHLRRRLSDRPALLQPRRPRPHSHRAQGQRA